MRERSHSQKYIKSRTPTPQLQHGNVIYVNISQGNFPRESIRYVNKQNRCKTRSHLFAMLCACICQWVNVIFLLFLAKQSLFIFFAAARRYNCLRPQHKLHVSCAKRRNRGHHPTDIYVLRTLAKATREAQSCPIFFTAVYRPTQHDTQSCHANLLYRRCSSLLRKEGRTRLANTYAHNFYFSLSRAHDSTKRTLTARKQVHTRKTIYCLGLFNFNFNKRTNLHVSPQKDSINVCRIPPFVLPASAGQPKRQRHRSSFPLSAASASPREGRGAEGTVYARVCDTKAAIG